MSNPKKLPPPPAVVDPNQRFPIPESSAILRQSIAKTYLDIRAGRLKLMKDGRRSYISGADLIRRAQAGA